MTTKKVSTSEKGHGKNVSTFVKLVKLSSNRSGMAPASALLTSNALSSLTTAAKNSIDIVSTAYAAYKLKVDERAAGFKPINKLVTRVSKALKSCDGVSKENLETFAVLVRTYRGARKTVVKPAVSATDVVPERHSVAQLSYDSRVANLHNLLNFLKTLAIYITNEDELTIDNFSNRVAGLAQLNDDVIDTISNLGNARIARNEILYAPTTGLVDVGYKLKNYMASKFGSDSPVYKQISKLSFSRM